MDLRPLPLSDLPAAFRERAAMLVGYAPAGAHAFEEAAAWLEACLESHLDETLSVAAAAREGGWSYEGLRRRVANSDALNAGTARRPRIRRGDLQALGAGRSAPGGSPVATPEMSHDAEPASAGEQSTVEPPLRAPTAAATDLTRPTGAARTTAIGRPAVRSIRTSDSDPLDPVFTSILARVANG